MVSKSDVLEADWQLLRIEISGHDELGELDTFDGYSRFWCKQAVLGAYWVAERVSDTKVRLHLTDDIELEGFKESLSFTPDTEFKRELLSRCDWEEVIREIFPEEDENSDQLSLFDDDD